MYLVPGEVLTFDFYVRDPATVARELLGKRLIRRLGGDVLDIEMGTFEFLKFLTSRVQEFKKSPSKALTSHIPLHVVKQGVISNHAEHSYYRREFRKKKT